MVNEILEKKPILSNNWINKVVPFEYQNKIWYLITPRLGFWVIWSLIAIILLRNNGLLGILDWLVGSFLGWWLLDLDWLVDFFWLRQGDGDPKVNFRITNLNSFWKSILENEDKSPKLIFHSVVFQVILLGIGIYVLFSSNVLFPRALILSLMGRMVYEEARDFLSSHSLSKWLWQLNFEINSELQGGLLFLFVISWLVLTLLMI